MPPDPRVHAGVAAVVSVPDPYQVLMIRRVGSTGYAADGRDTWSVPGGWLDQGESPEEAAEREVLEETGVTVRASHRAGFVVCHTTETPVPISIVTCFVVCDYVSGTPHVTEPDKCAEPQWMNWRRVRSGELPLFDPLQQWLTIQGWHQT